MTPAPIDRRNRRIKLGICNRCYRLQSTNGCVCATIYPVTRLFLACTKRKRGLFYGADGLFSSLTQYVYYGCTHHKEHRFDSF